MWVCSRRLTTKKMRRNDILLGLMLLTGLVLAGVCDVDGVHALEPAPEPEEDTATQVEYLFQLTATSAMYEAGAGEHDGVLSLIDTANSTVVFSDRPERIAYTASTDALIAELFAPVDGPNDNSFYVDPPNAAVSCMDSSGAVIRAVYVLRAPSVSTVNDTSLLSFEIDVLYADVSDDVSCDGLATLVIDNDLRRSVNTMLIENMTGKDVVWNIGSAAP